MDLFVPRLGIRCALVAATNKFSSICVLFFSLRFPLLNRRVKYYRINYLTSRNIRNESLFLNLAHDEEEGNLGRIIERRANFLPRSKMKRIPQKISLEAERIAVPLKSSSLNRNDTPIYIYIRKGTLLSGVAYPRIDIGLIESYPRGTSCRAIRADPSSKTGRTRAA